MLRELMFSDPWSVRDVDTTDLLESQPAVTNDG